MEPLLDLLKNPTRASWLEFAGGLGHQLANATVAQLEAAQVRLSKVDQESESNATSVGVLNALLSGFLQQRHHAESFEHDALESEVDDVEVDLELLSSTLSGSHRLCLRAAGTRKVFVATQLKDDTKLLKEQVSVACRDLRKHRLIEALGKGADGRTRPHQLTEAGKALWRRLFGPQRSEQAKSRRSFTDKVVL